MAIAVVRFSDDSGFSFQAGSDWEDSTQETIGLAKPYTLTKADGVGALQFSMAQYQSGPAPDPSTDDLLSMAKELGKQMNSGTPSNAITQEGPPRLASVDFHTPDGDMLRIWYASDGNNIMVITYVCEWDSRGVELPECQKIVESIRFDE